MSVGAILGKLVGALVVVGVGAAVGAWVEENVAPDHDRARARAEGWPAGRAVRPLAVAVSLLVALGVLGVDPVTIAALVAGAALLTAGLAAARALEHAAAGLWLAFVAPYAEGDEVVCAGIAGTVVRRGLWATELAVGVGRVTVPNGVVVRTPIVNASRAGRVQVVVPIELGELDPGAFHAELVAALSTPPVAAEPAPTVDVVGVTPGGGLRVEVRAWGVPSERSAVVAAVASAAANVLRRHSGGLP